MSNRVFKNYQVNVGLPFQIKPALNFQTIRHVENVEDVEIKEAGFESIETKEEIIKEAQEEAEMIIKEAKLEADRIVEEAERISADNAAASEEAARIKGYEDGFEEVKKQYEDLILEAEYVREHARVEYRDVLASIESDAVNMIIDISKKVLGSEVAINRDNILSLIRQAFEKCSNKENVVLKVSSDDYEYVCDNKEKILMTVEGIGELEIKKDSSLRQGGCIVETPLGSIDGSLQTKLKKIEEAFRLVMRR